MTKRAKLLEKARQGSQLKFSELTRLLSDHGFSQTGGSGSHEVWKHPGIPTIHLTLQRGKNGNAKPYQVRQVLNALDEVQADGPQTD